ncbi:hypothetical protein KSP39_PZI017219 [Platanthera zijinensis]|uniref:Uncharacterized protein n=1 Tax=Platanthera zijinensis TaxID=2320716 RepID=A0AAP0B691_9ASPA
MREEGDPDSVATLTDLPSFGKPPKIYGSDCSQHLAAAAKSDTDAADEGGVDFAFLIHEPVPHLPITADDIFSGGQICPLYSSAAVREKPKRLRLQQFLIQEREYVTSPSSADELEGISPGTYCLWSPGGNPNSTGRPPDRVEETCSTEWLFRRLIRDTLLGSRRSRGKERVVILTAEKKISPPRNKMRAKLDRKEKEGEDGERTGRNGFDGQPAAVLRPEWSCAWQDWSCTMPESTNRQP